MRAILFTWLFLALLSTWATADTIVLRNGERIETQGTWEENGVIKYFKDGTIAKGIPKENVSRIETDQTEAPAESSAAEPIPSEIDLGKQLSKKFTPRNPIEKAGSATVTIKTTVSSGSGFFITADGYILTNKHVIKGDEKKLKELEKKLRKAKEYLKRADRILKAERHKIKEMEKQIQSDRRYNTSYNIAVLNDARKQYRSRYAVYKKQKAMLEERDRKYRNLKTELILQKTIRIFLIDQTELRASIEKISDRLDLALLKLSGYKTPLIRLGQVRDVAQGDVLYAIGNPLNFSHSVSAGVFSGHQRGMLMISAPINPGNSGGPLVTAEGKVVGINTMKMVGDGVEGIGFAIPIDVAVHEFKDILEPHLTFSE